MQSTVILDLLGTAGAKVAAGTTPAPPLVAACAGRPDPRRAGTAAESGVPARRAGPRAAVQLRHAGGGGPMEWGAAQRALLAPPFPAQRFHTPSGAL
jgi:hypothetical protein